MVEDGTEIYTSGKVYTTGEISKICEVAPRTAHKWIDQGHLKGYKIPGSQDRRATEIELRKFLIEHNMICFLHRLSEHGSHYGK